MVGNGIVQLSQCFLVGITVAVAAFLSGGFESADMPLGQLAQARGIEFGTAVTTDSLRGDAYRELLVREFTTLVPEFEMKFADLHPAANRYTFAAADEIVTFARDRQLSLRGHALIWHRSLPEWLLQGAFPREALLGVMEAHIRTVVGRFRVQVPVWDVVNEAIADTIDNPQNPWRNTLWWRAIGPEYVEAAFRFAHATDPTARLFYNDYGGEGLGPKSDAIYQMLKLLRERGVPVHGVGLQMHVDIANPPDPAAVAANVRRLAALGLEVQITEMDVSLKNGTGSLEERLSTQATVYQQMFRVCLNAPNCTAFVVWGLSDRQSWLSEEFSEDAPLLFDRAYRPKPAYDALRDLLATRAE